MSSYKHGGWIVVRSVANLLAVIGVVAVALTWHQPVAAATPTRPLEQTIVVRNAGPCVDQAELVRAVAAWLRTYSVDARLAILVTRRPGPDPTLSFWVWRQRKPVAERHLPVQSESCEGVLDALAFAVALAIDATILDAPPAPAHEEASPRPLPEREPPAAPASPTIGGIWLGPAWVTSAGEVRPWVAGTVGGFARPWWPLRAELDLGLTLSGGSVDLPTGIGQTRLGWARLALLVEPWPTASVSPALGVGAGALMAWAGAEAAPGATAANDQATVALLLMRGRVGFALSRHLSTALVLSAGYAAPELVLRSDRHPATGIGRPLVDAGLAASYVWH